MFEARERACATSAGCVFPRTSIGQEDADALGPRDPDRFVNLDELPIFMVHLSDSSHGGPVHVIMGLASRGLK
jgi:hypothetical protein